MKRLLHSFVVILGCLHLCGGHWGIMQMVAWSRMIVEYSSKDGILEGTKKTFDGQHPCCMCKAIETGKKNESSSGKPLSTSSQGLVLKDCLPTSPTEIVPPLPVDCPVLATPDWIGSACERGYRPPVPPPRLA